MLLCRLSPQKYFDKLILGSLCGGQQYIMSSPGSTPEATGLSSPVCGPDGGGHLVKHNMSFHPYAPGWGEARMASGFELVRPTYSK